MVKRVLLCVMCIALLSACDTGGGNSSGATLNSLSGESYIPIDLDAITETTTGMIISGAIEHNSGEASAFWIPVDRGLDAYRNIEIEARNGYILRLTHRSDLGAGTYPINTTLDVAPAGDDIAGGLLYLWSPDEAQQYTLNPQGSMTIRMQGQDLLGSFNLTVENPAGERIEIEGQFYTQESLSAVR